MERQLVLQWKLGFLGTLTPSQRNEFSGRTFAKQSSRRLILNGRHSRGRDAFEWHGGRYICQKMLFILP
jgi:hypothetical protein